MGQAAAFSNVVHLGVRWRYRPNLAARIAANPAFILSNLVFDAWPFDVAIAKLRDDGTYEYSRLGTGSGARFPYGNTVLDNPL